MHRASAHVEVKREAAPLRARPHQLACSPQALTHFLDPCPNQPACLLWSPFFVEWRERDIAVIGPRIQAVPRSLTPNSCGSEHPDSTERGLRAARKRSAIVHWRLTGRAVHRSLQRRNAIRCSIDDLPETTGQEPKLAGGHQNVSRSHALIGTRSRPGHALPDQEPAGSRRKKSRQTFDYRRECRRSSGRLSAASTPY